MQNAIIFGAGGTGRKVLEAVNNKYSIKAFLDNDKTKWGEIIQGIEVHNPEDIRNMEYDVVLLGTLMGYEELRLQLDALGVDQRCIIGGYVDFSVQARIVFLKRYAEEAYRKNISGCVAEAGVFRGEFSKEINYYFPDRRCYLFDTFDGFAENDIKLEKKESLIVANYMKGLNEKEVYEKMPHKELVTIKKGYFPETTVDVDEQLFCFVNLDMDLYAPTLAGLRYFYPRMAKGGVILIHDFFSDAYPNLKDAIYDYEKENNIFLAKMPIGDDISIAIIKY